MNATYDAALDLPVHRNIRGWPLIDDTTVPVAATAVYLLLAIVVGPNLMSDRKPFNLRLPMMMHNLLLCLMNAWIFLESGRALFFNANNWTKCMMPGQESDPFIEARFTYVYYLTKYLDWLDTLFLVLRKKDEHLSFLHLYHHAAMPIGMLFIARQMPGGHTSILPFLNSFIHVLMYAYYFLSSFGPRMQPYLWWKRYLTRIQILQFIVGSTHLALITLMYPACPHPRPLIYTMIVNGIAFLCMFAHFYVVAYVRDAMTGKTKHDLSIKQQ